SRPIRPRSQVEVAWILVQKRWQKSAANHDVSDGVGSIGTEPFAETLHSLTVIGSICRLLGAGKHCYDGPVNWIGDFLKGEGEFQLRRERFWVRVIDGIEVGDDAKDPLLQLRLDLLGGNFLGGITHIDGGLHLCESEFAACYYFVLSRLKHDDG